MLRFGAVFDRFGVVFGAETIENGAGTIENGAETIENGTETIENGAETIENGGTPEHTIRIIVRDLFENAPKAIQNLCLASITCSQNFGYTTKPFS